MLNNDLQEIVKRVKESVSIDELILENGIELIKQGNELVGYHSNKHNSSSKKSLYVNPIKGLYYCFNCGEGGDHFAWLEKNRNMRFKDAIFFLANKAKIPLKNFDGVEIEKEEGNRIVKNKVLKLYAIATEIYHEQLTDVEYRMLLEKWGLNAKLVDKYKIGFAPANGKFIKQELLKRKFPEPLINLSGLVNDNGYDLFQGRLVFPYWNNGQVVYFIARMTDKTPDNSWENAKYKKLPIIDDPRFGKLITNDHFIGEDSLWGADEVIITEGVTDCYVALQHGFACISPATTSFRTDDYAKLLKLTKNLKTVYICNDNETSKAGEKGAIKTAEYLEENDVLVKFINLPLEAGQDKIDLAEYLRDHGKDRLSELMKEAKTLLEIDFELLTVDVNNRDLLNNIFKRIASIESDVESEVWMKKVKDITGIGIKAIRADIEKITKITKAQSEADPSDESRKVADHLIQITKEKAVLFHDEFKDGYAIITMQSHRKTLALNSGDFKNWLIKQYYDLTRKSPNKDAIKQATETLNAIAVYEEEKNTLFLRVAKWSDLFWYDLSNDEWQVVKITPNGWLVNDKPPAIFRRHANTEPQVMPIRTDNHNLELLDKYFNLQNQEDFVLLYACVASFLVPEIPHPIIIFFGDKGSAKTTAQRVIRKLIDPAVVETVFFPRNKDDLAIQLQHNYVPCFDNLDGLKDYQSDILCQAVTGGGTSKRKNYTDTDEVIIRFKRCIMLNGINLVATRDDLLDRSIIIRLDRISKDNRKEEAEFWKEFEEDRPLILGSLFNIICKAMAIFPTVKLNDLPRMADFARWGYALTEAMGKSGDQFLNTYYKNIATANEEAVLDNMVSSAVMEFMEDNNHWKGTATALLTELTGLDSVHETDKKWPKKPHTLSKELNRMSSALADQGIEIIRSRDSKNKIIELHRKA